MNSRLDYQRWRDSLQGGGEGSGSVVPGKQLLTQRQQNKRAVRGLQETAEGARPYPHRLDLSGEGGKLQVPWRTHHWQSKMVHPHRQCGEEGATVPSSTSGGWKNVACHWKPSLTFTGAQLRASCRAVSPSGMATAMPTTAGLSRGWCGQGHQIVKQSPLAQTWYHWPL